MEKDQIVLKKVRVHNLKEVDLTLDKNQLIVFTGVSGSGKSSLAFDTIYVEGQRRYIDSLSTYARRHIGDMSRPDADLIEGVSPTIAIEQKTTGKNPRSTVGTLTGIYDYLRLIYARIGHAHCPITNQPVKTQSLKQIDERVFHTFKGKKILILSPYAEGKKGEFKEDFVELMRKGYMRMRLDGKLVDLSEELHIDGKLSHDIDVVIDRLVVDEENRTRVTEALVSALQMSDGLVKIFDVAEEKETLLSKHAFCKESNTSYGPLEPSDFSFNHPQGMCSSCQGLGIALEFDLEKIINDNLSIAEDCCSIASSYATVRYGNIYDNLARLYNFSVKEKWKNLSPSAKKVFLYGTESKWTRMTFIHPSKGSRWHDYIEWKGVIEEARQRYQNATSEGYRAKMKELMRQSLCTSCGGSRIKPYPTATRIGKKKIHELTAMSTLDLYSFFQNLILDDLEAKIASEPIKEIMQRLCFLHQVGLGYLSLDRTAPTLSGGEGQRVRLASQIGSGLVGSTYVLDEPSIGLHPRDNTKLLATLKNLRDLGNTVIVVEHDEETIEAADVVVDVGPFAGELGGRIVAVGGVQDILSCQESLTGQYLSGALQVAEKRKLRKVGKESIKIEKASHHNLKDITVSFPLHVFTAVTGVSGSGKSSLVMDILFPALSNALHNALLHVGAHKKISGMQHIDKVISIDQTPIGKTPRSNPATYVKLFDEIRDLFSALPESVACGFDKGRFSFNVKEGSCPFCSGMGMKKIDMDFMEDQWVTCDRCQGERFDAKTLSILFKGKNIHDILQMTIKQASEFFANQPKILSKLSFLMKVGLDYIRLGQPSPTLSGGEAQRIKLAKELSRPSTGKTLYILDEPTTGLHFHDVKKLLDVLHSLVDKGNTVIVIEHNMDLVKTADWIVDIGPEAGIYGGMLVACGTPQTIASMDTPTAYALSQSLHKKKGVMVQTPVHFAPKAQFITVEGAEQNNLKRVSCCLPREKITVCTGPSGSGKSSFAFETIYAEGQRRYSESLSHYARQFIEQMPRPKVERIEGLSAAIAIEQKSHAGNPRSTMGTMTETYDYLRVLYAHLGTAFCPETKEKIQSISKEYVADKILQAFPQERLYILAPLLLSRSENFELMKDKLLSQGFLRIRINGQYFELDETIPYDGKQKNEILLVIDRLIMQKTSRKRVLEAIESADKASRGTIVVSDGKSDTLFNLCHAAPSTGKSYPPITPHTFSFNTEQGMCLECQGLGLQYGANFVEDQDFLSLSPLDIVSFLWKDHATKVPLHTLLKILQEEGIDPEASLDSMTKTQLQFFFYGAEPKENEKKGKICFSFRGISHTLIRYCKSSYGAIRPHLTSYLEKNTCLCCEGTRLNPLARNVKIQDVTLPQLCKMPLENAARFLATIDLQGNLFLEQTLEQLTKRLHFLLSIGLGYLSLERSAPTLSGGETQRIRLSRQIGSGLTGCLYVLDEPTIGLHPHNSDLLNAALRKLCSLGNTLVLVEHDPLTVKIADHIIDFGPQAGVEGGKIMAQGSLEQICQDEHSLTGAYLSGRKRIAIPKKRRKGKHKITIKQAVRNNLKGFDVALPVSAITCITGVSGAGKSTLMLDIIRPAVEKTLFSRTKKDSALVGVTLVEGISHFDRCLTLDQNPAGTTNRADVSTYVDVLTPLRHLFGSLAEAKIRGLMPKHFSYNHKQGMCSSCSGLGVKTISMQFLPSIKVACEVCHGFRLNPLSLKVHFKGKNMGEVLAMTVDEALLHFSAIPKMKRILDTLQSVGLGYLSLGQEIATLSGGEMQRLKLSRELSKRSSGNTLYLLDEPSIGLHSEDIAKLTAIFHALVDKGNTIIMVEHNVDLMANSDFIVDIGPEAGEKGGELVASGSPEELAEHPHSLTAKYLKDHLENTKKIEE